MQFSEHYPLNLLVAESKPSQQSRILPVLEHLGYKPKCSSTGTQILDCLALQNFDLLLLDLQMPGVRGIEISLRIRAQYPHRPKIIALSNLDTRQEYEAYLTAGLDDYLSQSLLSQQIQVTLCRWYHQLTEVNVSNQHEQLNIAELLTRVGHDTQILQELAMLFSADGERLLNVIERALLTQDIPAVKKAAHEFKGICSIFNTHRLKAHCKNLEKADLAQAETHMKETQTEFLEVRKLIQELLLVFESTAPV